MREYLVRVRHHGDDYTATLRQVAAGTLLDAPPAPTTTDTRCTARTCLGAITGAFGQAALGTITPDRRLPPDRPTHGGYPTIEPPDTTTSPETGRVRLTDAADAAARTREAMIDAWLHVSGVIGCAALHIPPTVNLDQLPAGVVAVARNTMLQLEAAVGVLDPSLPAEDLAHGVEWVDDAVARWAKGQGA